MAPTSTTQNPQPSSTGGPLRPLHQLQSSISSTNTISPTSDSVYEISKASIEIEERPFAYGGNSDLYIGKWTAPGDTVAQEVAVKMLRFKDTTVVVLDSVTGKPLERKERLDKRLKREMRILKKIQHPNVNPLYGYTNSKNNPLNRDSPCLISPLHRQGNLREYLKKADLEVDRLMLLEQVANALTCMHACDNVGIAHLDIKPENILITDSGDAMICDLGLAKVLDGAKTGLTTGGGPAWSLPYASKEVLDGENVTKSADVYSYGMLVLEVLSGLPPFYKWLKPNTALVLHICKGELPQQCDHTIQGPPEAVKKVWELIDACWVSEPTARLTMPQVEEQLVVIRGKMSAT